MNEAHQKGKQRLWYVRQKGVVRGPFPAGAVRRSLVLGRVTPADEVSSDGKQWRPAAEVPEVTPPELRKALEEGDEAVLLVARRREDMRSGRERRTAESDRLHRQRRKGERRAEETRQANQRRAARSALIQRKKESLPLRPVLISTLLVAGIIGYGLYRGTPTALPESACESPPSPGVNWRNCRLDGGRYDAADLARARANGALLRGARLSGARLVEAELEYVDFSGADLSYAQLDRARLKGANFQNADLTNAVFSGADLRFAILRGARAGGIVLEGARLGHAVWFDGSSCQAGSVGVCNRVGR